MGKHIQQQTRLNINTVKNETLSTRKKTLRRMTVFESFKIKYSYTNVRSWIAEDKQVKDKQS